MSAWQTLRSVARHRHLPLVAGSSHRCSAAVPISNLTEEAQGYLAGLSESIVSWSSRQPFVTLTYAQGLDGSIAHDRLDRLVLSNTLSMEFTHSLRSMHAAILVGIGTVMADDPRLTTRLPGATHNPLPIVLDSALRIPLGCRLVQNAAVAASGVGLVVATTPPTDGVKVAKLLSLEAQDGVRVLQVPAGADGLIELSEVLTAMQQEHSCRSVMIEGGAAVIASCLKSPELLDQVVVTIAPRLVGGVTPAAALRRLDARSIVNLSQVQSLRLGDDVIIAGHPARGEGLQNTNQPSHVLEQDKQKVRNGYVNGKRENGVANLGSKQSHAKMPWAANDTAQTGGREVEGTGGLRFLSDCRMWVEAVRAECRMCLYKSGDITEVVALVKGDVAGATQVPVRIHSECFTGDILGSRRCDCGEQLHSFLQTMDTSNQGILLYIRGHEGRGIGLANKIRAYKLQEVGQDTVDANLSLGLEVDSRSYDECIGVLKDLGVESITLYSNNPDKAKALGSWCSKVVPMVSSPQQHNWRYLETKRSRLNHATILPELQATSSQMPG
mmetsp:Transcript_16466/g.37969  ORF Transcript_16466/g.37969 Transcript_16466/m.37969 type:complete len:555 (-) Transcript_16466:145-1809(-)